MPAMTDGCETWKLRNSFENKVKKCTKIKLNQKNNTWNNSKKKKKEVN